MNQSPSGVTRLVLILLASLCSLPLQAQLGDAERAAVGREIGAALANYHQVFSTGTPADMAREIYGVPLVSIAADGSTTVRNSRAEVEQWLDSFMDNLRASGWYRSRMPEPTICVLSANLGFASGQFVRYREDGSEISRNGMTYIFQRKPEGWRMTTFLAQEDRLRVNCD